MSYENDEKKEGLTLKNKVALVAFGIVILALMVYNFATRRTSEFPDGTLSKTKGQTKFEKNEDIFEFFYQFEDVPYVVGTPTKGITKVEGGYAYTYNNIGLVVAEVSHARTMLAYSTDMYSSLYAVQSQPDVKELASETGYINGYAATYGVYEVKLPELDKTVYELMYFLNVDKENIVLAATTESKKSEDLTAARDFLVKMISTVASYSEETTDEPVSEDVEGDTKETKSNMYDDSSVIRQAVLTASEDYDQMCLIFSYINVNATPDECYVLDKNDKKYNAAFINPGEYGFVIPNVSAGDDVTVYIKSKELDGAMLSQQEYADYKKEQETYKEGNLHVEEDMEEVSTESDSQTDEVTEDEGVSMDDLTEMIESAGVDGDTMKKITKLDE